MAIESNGPAMFQMARELESHIREQGLTTVAETRAFAAPRPWSCNPDGPRSPLRTEVLSEDALTVLVGLAWYIHTDSEAYRWLLGPED